MLDGGGEVFHKPRVFPVVHAKVFCLHHGGQPLRLSVHWLGILSVSPFGYLHSP